MKSSMIKLFVSLWLGTVPLFSALADEGGASDVNAEKVQKVIQKSFTDGVGQIRNMKLEQLALEALNNIVQRGVEKLREAGHQEFADQSLKSWGSLNLKLQGDISSLALGDHQPLSQWLAKFYNGLESRLGKFICETQHLDDIKNINYGYMVTVHPRGTQVPKDSWGIEEYRLHFVPFTTAVLYWTMNAACSTIVEPIKSGLCTILVEGPRYAYKQFLAPDLSDEVYRHYTK